MFPFLQHVQTLVRLGLTVNEAKIFLVLCTIGTATARMISENAGVAREVVYQVLPTLQEKALVEAVLTSPQSYKAISVEHAYGILLKRNSEENKKTKKDVKKSIRALQKMVKKDVGYCPQITLVPRGKALFSKIVSELRTTHTNVDILISWQKFLKWHRLYVREIEEAQRRNVKFQVLIEDEIPQSRTSTLSSLVFESTYFEYLNMRFVPNSSLVNMIIFDQKKAFIDIESEKGPLETPFLFSDNKNITPLAVNYFRTNWDIAIPLQNTKKTLQNALTT